MLTQPLKEGARNVVKEKRQPNAVRVRRHTGESQKCNSFAGPSCADPCPTKRQCNAPKTSLMPPLMPTRMFPFIYWSYFNPALF
jgi:hypothetical protein